MNCEECAGFQQKLAIHTAPALLGIKPANLMSLDRTELDVKSNAEIFNKRAAAKGLRIKILCDCERRSLVLLYSVKLMEQLLSEECRRKMLESFGYGRELDTEECLERLAQRSAQHSDFPHEIGLFLGYPVEDVEGFIKNKGCGFKLCGYWKVYGNAEQAKKTFRSYDKCRSFLCNKLSEGVDLYQALRI